MANSYPTSQDRKSTISLTGVAPITVLNTSPDAGLADPSKSRLISNVTLSQYNAGNFLDFDTVNAIGSESFNLLDPISVPSLEDISIDNATSGTYLDASGKTRARIVFNIKNPDTTKIVDVDIRQSLTSTESGL
jgi:hypothetical protein